MTKDLTKCDVCCSRRATQARADCSLQLCDGHRECPECGEELVRLDQEDDD